ncbi:MBL fold metallo-hydrolase [Erwinia billingiae]|uniref:MBL fold metallo-hydrolase n=1 Tax=Erwinia billingiae TaxID=182337 RepID=UPI00320B2D9E
MQKKQAGYLHVMVGKFEVSAISDGTVALPVEKLLSEPEKLTKSALQKSFIGLPAETSVNAYLINTGEKLILVDTGAGQLLSPTLGKLTDNIRAAGYHPEEIDDIVLTHLHPDHVGGLMSAGKQVFPKAIIHAEKADTDYWLSPSNQKENGDASGFFKGDMASLNTYVRSGQLKPFSGKTVIAPGVIAINAPGHTPGHVIYQVESAGKRLYIIGDLIHVGAVQFSQPGVTISFDSNEKQARDSREKLFKKIANQGGLIAAAHLSFPGVGHIVFQNDSFGWVPLNYSTNL